MLGPRTGPARKVDLMSDLISVKLLEKRGAYKIGEVAGFSPHVASQLVQAGKALYVDAAMNAAELRACAERANNAVDAASKALEEAKAVAEKANADFQNAIKKLPAKDEPEKPEVEAVKSKEALPAIDKQAKPSETKKKGLFR